MINRIITNSKNFIFILVGISLLTSFSLVVISLIPSINFMEIDKIEVIKVDNEYKFKSKINFKYKGFYFIGLNIRNDKSLIGCARLFLRDSRKSEIIDYDFAKYFPKRCLNLIGDENHRELKLVVSISKHIFGLHKIIYKEHNLIKGEFIP